MRTPCSLPPTEFRSRQNDVPYSETKVWDGWVKTVTHVASLFLTIVAIFVFFYDTATRDIGMLQCCK